MKKNNGLLLLAFLCPLWILFNCSSCTTAKKLTIMDDLSPNETIRGPKPAPIYHIKIKDNLFVSISTPDQDLTRTTDPTASGGAALSYEGSASRAVNGNVVDGDGNITLPMLCKVSVVGKTLPEAEDTIRSIAK